MLEKGSFLEKDHTCKLSFLLAEVSLIDQAILVVPPVIFYSLGYPHASQHDQLVKFNIHML